MIDEARLLLAPEGYRKDPALFERTQQLICEVCSSLSGAYDRERRQLISHTRTLVDVGTIFSNLPSNLPDFFIERIGLRELTAENLRDIQALLLRKNFEYGNAAVEPSSYFCDQPPRDRIAIRIEDKLSRLQQIATMRREDVAIEEDTAKDLIGYLVLDLVLERLEGEGLIAESARSRGELLPRPATTAIEQ